MAIKFLNDVAVDSDVLYVDTANNRVGINDSTPTATLDVIGTINSTSSITTNGSIRIDSTGTPTLILDTGGYYPGATIEVRKNNSSSPSMGGLYWYRNPGTESSQWITRLDSSPYTTSSITLPTTSGYHFTIVTQATERFRINSSTGNVGIHDSSPSEKLAVNGNVTADRYYGNGSTTYYVDPNDSTTSAILNGKVGIGTASPSEKLEVNGNVKADAFIGQRISVNNAGYHGTANINTVFALYSTDYGMTNSTSNNRYHPFAPILMPFNGVVEKIIVKNFTYSSYTSGPSASGNAKLQLNQYDSTFAPMDYSSGNVAYTAAAGVTLTFTPNQAYNEGTHFRVFWSADGAWRYMVWTIVLKQTS